MPTLSPQQIALAQAISAEFQRRLVGAWFAAGSPRVGLTSFFRSVEENRRIGGDPESQHLVAAAADLTGVTSAFRQQMERVLVVVPFARHTHVQLFPASFQLVRRFFPQLVD